MTNIEKLKKFARTIIQDTFDASDIDPSVVQEHAVKLGLLVVTKYDPKIHGPSDYDAELGDPCYIFSDLIKE